MISALTVDNKHKHCLDCATVLPVKEFYRNVRNKKDGLSSYCKCCTKTRAVKSKKIHGSKCSRAIEGFSSKKLLKSVKSRAKVKGLHFNLTEAWVEAQLSVPCVVTGFDFYLGEEKYHPLSPSVDKIDPSKDYTIDNCRLVVYWYNVSKLNYTDELVLSMCTKVVNQAKVYKHKLKH